MDREDLKWTGMNNTWDENNSQEQEDPYPNLFSIANDGDGNSEENTTDTIDEAGSMTNTKHEGVTDEKDLVEAFSKLPFSDDYEVKYDDNDGRLLGWNRKDSGEMVQAPVSEEDRNEFIQVMESL